MLASNSSFMTLDLCTRDISPSNHLSICSLFETPALSQGPGIRPLSARSVNEIVDLSCSKNSKIWITSRYLKELHSTRLHLNSLQTPLTTTDTLVLHTARIRLCINLPLILDMNFFFILGNNTSLSFRGSCI